MAKSKTQIKQPNTFKKRVTTALLMLPVVIGALWFGYPYVDILALLVGVLLSWEWANMVPSRKPLAYFGAYTLSLAVSIFVYNTHAIVLTVIFATPFLLVFAV